MFPSTTSKQNGNADDRMYIVNNNISNVDMSQITDQTGPMSDATTLIGSVNPFEV